MSQVYRSSRPIIRTIEEVLLVEPIFYTVQAINGDYAQLISDEGQPHFITMFLLPEGTTVGSRLKLELFQWELLN